VHIISASSIHVLSAILAMNTIFDPLLRETETMYTCKCCLELGLLQPIANIAMVRISGGVSFC
jgi:hypothetical protein